MIDMIKSWKKRLMDVENEKNYLSVKLTTERRNKVVLFWLAVGVVGCILGAWFLTMKNIDEDKWCDNQVKTYYPEYKDDYVEYIQSDEKELCRVYHITTKLIDARDGLALTQPSETKVVDIEVTSKEDIAYLHSDDFTLIIANIFLLVSVFLATGGWLAAWKNAF